MIGILKHKNKEILRIELDFIDQNYIDQTYTYLKEIDGREIRVSAIVVDEEEILPVIGENFELIEDEKSLN